MRPLSSLTPTLAQLLTPDVVAKRVRGKLAVMERLGLAQNSPVPQYLLTFRGSAATETGPAGEYESCWSHFYKFCVLLGQYESCILLDCDLCLDRPIWSNLSHVVCTCSTCAVVSLPYSPVR
jgi:hypothetical protein